MDVADIAAFQVTSKAALVQQQASMAIMKKAADAQMQMATLIAQQADQTKAQGGFSVYA